VLHDQAAVTPNGTSTEYPLYKRGVEREKFEKAVRFLKKDIEQLMHARGVDVVKGTHMLGNLKKLLMHETARK
jgi:hypothetical protein